LGVLKECVLLKLTNGCIITPSLEFHSDICPIFRNVYEKVANKKMAKETSFQVTGLHPFNPDVSFSDEDFLPSEVIHSLQGNL
jgi:hypothetical protein